MAWVLLKDTVVRTEGKQISNSSFPGGWEGLHRKVETTQIPLADAWVHEMDFFCTTTYTSRYQMCDVQNNTVQWPVISFPWWCSLKKHKFFILIRS